MLLAPALSFDDDARQLRIVRRRARRVREENRTEVPGVILFEIDGLAEPVLRQALSEGHAPTMASWLENASHRIVPWECDLSSQTGASQAGLLLGSNYDMPAFRWYEKETGRTMVSNHGKDASRARAAALRRWRPPRCGWSQPGQHVLRRRASLFGDNERDQGPPTLAERRSTSPTSPIPTASPARSLSISGTWSRSGWRRAVSAGAVTSTSTAAGLYPWMRGAITVVMRDLNVATLLGDIVEGVPVVYSTFVGYDEVAHHSGIEQPDAFAVLRQHDAQLARLEHAVAQAPRPYHLVVLSDHGQSQGRPFRQRYGRRSTSWSGGR